jgi:ubiquinol-cytochrome c reductase cytochrome b subunit
MFGKARDWLVDRFALQPIYQHLLDRRVPKAPWYSGDGTTLLALLSVQVLTGMVLALTYSPAAGSAYESVTQITDVLLMGRFVRGVHYWSAGIMVVVLFFHMFRQILMGGYKSPREGTWIIGTLLLFCVLLMAYTGYLLRWDERAIHAVRVMLHMLHRVPWLGDALLVVVQGGPQIGPQTLTRLYAVHVLIIPLVMYGLTSLHMYLVVQRGTITRTEQKEPPQSAREQKEIYKAESHSAAGEEFFPTTMFKTGVTVTLVLGLVALLAMVVGPPELMAEANLVAASQPSEEWWFWWFSGLIALLPPAVAPWFVVLFPLVVFVALMALPIVDRSPQRGIRRRLGWLVVVLTLVVAMLALSDYRRRSAFTGWPEATPPKAPEGLTLSADAERGRVLFAEYGCNSCHAVAGQGRQVAVDFSQLEVPRSRDYIESYVLDPPAGGGDAQLCEPTE